MRDLVRVLTAASIVLATCGCAGYSVTRKPGPDAEGLRFYRPEPYLLVSYKATTQVTGTETRTILEPTVSTIWLPNYDEEYALRTWSWFSTATFNFTLTDGWRLTQTNATTDTTASLGKILELLKQGTEAGAFFPKTGDGKGIQPTPTPEERLQFRLFRVRVDARGARLEEVSLPRPGADTPAAPPQEKPPVPPKGGN